MSTLRVTSDVYMITADGLNIAIQVGADGLIVVDPGPARLGESILKAIKEISPLPVRYVIDTSADPERVGSNTIISRSGASLSEVAGLLTRATTITGSALVAHENVPIDMVTVLGGSGKYSGPALPRETYNRPEKNFFMNGQAIEILWQPAAHSNGDSVVLFRRSDVVVAGDILDETRFPVIDTEHGGSVDGEIVALNRLLSLVIAVTPQPWREGGTLLIPGKGYLCDQAEVVQYRDMVTIIRDRIKALIADGKTLEQVKAANPTRGYTPRYGANTGPWTTDMFVESVYKSLAVAK